MLENYIISPMSSVIEQAKGGHLGALILLRQEIRRMTVIKYVERHYGIPHQCLRLDNTLAINELRKTIERNIKHDYSAPVICLRREERFYWQITSNYCEKARSLTKAEKAHEKLKFKMNEIMKHMCSG